MYVIARREGETLCIADLIEVKVLSVTGKIVRLGFNAPREISIVRTEVAPDQDSEASHDHLPD